MEQLTQTISNLVGILMGLVGAVGRGLLCVRRLHVPDSLVERPTRWSGGRAP